MRKNEFPYPIGTLCQHAAEPLCQADTVPPVQAEPFAGLRRRDCAQSLSCIRHRGEVRCEQTGKREEGRLTSPEYPWSLTNSRPRRQLTEVPREALKKEEGTATAGAMANEHWQPHQTGDTAQAAVSCVFETKNGHFKCRPTSGSGNLLHVTG